MTSPRKLWWANGTLALVGLAVAGAWIAVSGGRQYLAELLDVRGALLPLLLAATALCVLVRFVRWQYLLRRAGVRLPARGSLAIYLASLVGIVTPAYVGEALRVLLIRRRFQVPIRATLPVLVLERLLDAAALALIAAATTPVLWLAAALAGTALGVIAAAMIALGIAPALGVPSAVAGPLRRVNVLAAGLAMSLAAWLPAAALVPLAAEATANHLPIVAGLHIFSSSTLLGGLTLMPAGVATMGSAAIWQLQHQGLDTTQAVVIVSLVRLASTGVTLCVAAVALARELAGIRRAPQTAAEHFDDIAAQYSAQFSPHVWQHLLDRKVGMVTSLLRQPPAQAGLGLDLGCGLGLQCREMSRRGYRVMGVDMSSELVQLAQSAGIEARTGSALDLPFDDDSFDFIYTVGVLHHLGGPEQQQQAFDEVIRVLKPGGLFIVHETNPRNPLFRFYMGYVFPVLKSIDEGTEWWIDPRRLRSVPGLALVSVRYFTFLPDFIPRWLMRPVLGVERWLETSPLQSYSVHYMAALRKEPKEHDPAAQSDVDLAVSSRL